MNILKLSITGADDQVNPKDLLAQSEKLPNIEWAILFSESRAGTLRYPTAEWRSEFYKIAPNVNRAAHLCGTPRLKQFADGDPALAKELENYQRIQLNFNSKHIKPEILDGLIEKTKSQYYKYKDGTPIQIITQYNDANVYIHTLFEGPNHAVLFDASGGNGVEISEIPQPLKGITCGYAGKLGPDNLQTKLELIDNAVGEIDIWVDMESGVRTENIFDMQKVQQVVEIVANYRYDQSTTFSPA